MAAVHSSVAKPGAIAAQTRCTAPILETPVVQAMEHVHLVGAAVEWVTVIHLEESVVQAEIIAQLETIATW